MNDVLLTNLFFTITAIAVVAVTAGILLALWYVVPTLRDLRDIVRKVHRAGENLEKDFDTLRANLHEEGQKTKTIIDLVLGFVAHKLRPKPPRAPKKSSSSEDQVH